MTAYRETVYEDGVWRTYYWPEVFNGASDGSDLSRWFFTVRPLVPDAGYADCANTPSGWYYGSTLGDALLTGDSTGVTGYTFTTACWLKFSGEAPYPRPTRFGIHYRGRRPGCGPGNANFSVGLLKGDDVFDSQDAWSVKSGTFSATGDGTSTVTKLSMGGFSAADQSWFDVPHSLTGVPTAYLLVGLAPIRLFLYELALVLEYGRNPEATDAPKVRQRQRDDFRQRQRESRQLAPRGRSYI